MSDEEKRQELFEVIEPVLRKFWKKYKYNQAMLVRMVNCLMDIEYLTTDLMTKMFRGIFVRKGPASIDRLIPMYEKLCALHGDFIRKRSSQRRFEEPARKDTSTHNGENRDNVAVQHGRAQVLHARGDGSQEGR